MPARLTAAIRRMLMTAKMRCCMTPFQDPAHDALPRTRAVGCKDKSDRWSPATKEKRREDDASRRSRRSVVPGLHPVDEVTGGGTRADPGGGGAGGESGKAR